MTTLAQFKTLLATVQLRVTNLERRQDPSHAAALKQETARLEVLLAANLSSQASIDEAVRKAKQIQLDAAVARSTAHQIAYAQRMADPESVDAGPGPGPEGPKILDSAIQAAKDNPAAAAGIGGALLLVLVLAIVIPLLAKSKGVQS